jgi:hypothetical protein
MMHKYHTTDNPGFTPKSANPPLSEEQWRNAYRDLKLKYERLQLELEKANEWRGDSDVGC